MADTGESYEGFSSSMTICPPKKVKQSEFGSPIVRTCQETRPIGMKCSDSKLVSSYANQPLTEHLSLRAHEAQRGFIPGRNFAANVLLADTLARLAVLEGVSLPACFIAYDFISRRPYFGMISIPIDMKNKTSPFQRRP